MGLNGFQASLHSSSVPESSTKTSGVRSEMSPLAAAQRTPNMSGAPFTFGIKLWPLGGASIAKLRPRISTWPNGKLRQLTTYSGSVIVSVVDEIKAAMVGSPEKLRSVIVVKTARCPNG